MSTPTATPSDSGSTTAAIRDDRFPPQTKFIVGNEACERFSFYGMRSILTLYCANALLMSKAESKEVGHLFNMAVYFLPLAGAWVADKWWGRYRTILYISLFYCLGHGVLALSDLITTTHGKMICLYTGLGFIAIGSGGIKPCVSAFVGDQFGRDKQHLLPKVYGLFYWSINFGSFFSFGLIPTIRQNYGYSWAFGVPGIAMALATFIFWLGTRHYVMMPPTRETKQAGFLAVLRNAWSRRKERTPGQPFFDAALGRFSGEEVAGAKAVVGILMVFASVPIFWSLFDQQSTSWVLQGESLTPLTLFSFDLGSHAWGIVTMFLKLFFVESAPGQFAFRLDKETIQSLNPLLVMLLIPLFTTWLYPFASRIGFRTTPLRRMSVGMLLAASSFLVCGWLQGRMDGGEKLSIAWQVPSYILLTAGEVLLSATGLEFAFSQAPKSMKSTIMSFWLLTVAVGNLLVAVVTNFNEKVIHARGASEFFFYAGLMVAVAAVFIFCATRYQERTFPPDAPGG